MGTKKMQEIMRSNNGSVMVMALFIFLIMVLLGSTILGLAAMENKIALADAREEQVRQAADAGVELARNVLMNYISLDKIKDIPVNMELELGDGLRAEINLDISKMADGILTIRSQGILEKADGIKLADKTAQADMYVDTLPEYPIRANTMRVTGKYFISVSDKTVGNLSESQNWHPYHEDRIRLDLYDNMPNDWEINRDIFNYPLRGRCYDEFEGVVDRDKHPCYTSSNSSPTYNVDYRGLQYKQHWTGGWIGLVRCGDGEWITTSEIANHGPLSETYLTVNPIYIPSGYINIQDETGAPADIALRNGNWENYSHLTPAEKDRLFEDTLPEPREEAAGNKVLYRLYTNAEFSDNVEIIYPDKDDVYDSLHFVNDCGSIIDDVYPPMFTDWQLRKYQEIAYAESRVSGSGWVYIAEDDLIKERDDHGRFTGNYILRVSELKGTKVYIDLPPDKLVKLDCKTNIIISRCVNLIWRDCKEEYFFYHLFNRKYDALFVTPADMEINVDTYLFRKQDGDAHLFFLSGGDIRLNSYKYLDCDDWRCLRGYMLAGENIYINVDSIDLNYYGILAANDTIYVNFVVGDPRLTLFAQDERHLDIKMDGNIVDYFPESWAYLGMAPIVSYKYID